MLSLQDEILHILSETGELDADELVQKVVQARSEYRNAQVRAAMFPLLSTRQISFSEDNRVKLTSDSAVPVAPAGR